MLWRDWNTISLIDIKKKTITPFLNNKFEASPLQK